MELKDKLILLLKSGGLSLGITTIFYTLLFGMSAQFHHQIPFSPFSGESGIDMMLVYSFLIFLSSSIFSYFFLKIHNARNHMHVDGLVITIKYMHLVLWLGVIGIATYTLLHMKQHTSVLQQAKDISTTPTQLEKLVSYLPEHGDVIDIAVASNSNTSAVTLTYLSLRRDFSTHLALASNPSTPKKVLEEIIGYYQGGQQDVVINAVLRNPNVANGSTKLRVH
ncbi:hypothetical protein J8Z24_04815 [Pseudoalteromonas sp. SCSIO 43201]|uniref:hypothetical protein n=1 Tax=Pseudoalteromonas TaxID=53246 RepID=UPI0020752AFE|nr:MULTISPECIES: hypothetical protein [Pseudoalteromonas]MDW7549787.1 hypothetical protein [Pseudoalteromonas peptidolytica]USD29411.1 hypothetical protein J8Z24_04815 [Pseudoalteromonas sp. SCSIO 43201]